MIEIIIVAHGNLAKSIFETTHAMSCMDTSRVTCFSVACNSDVESIIIELRNIFTAAEEGAIVLTDMFGGSGANISLLASRDLPKIKVITGVNMGMFISALNNRGQMDIEALAAKVEADGKRAVINATNFMNA
ncbi:mannose/fructose-specific phosphotransferase system component IIA [Elusimicrobium simillimum]|uniref:PTS sugar transporter subunit IIA n=1 Tax=Elusimicrobium simillimum TaxID=3143438 RepID=UPI003C6F368C